jgi:hypothetical protein
MNPPPPGDLMQQINYRQYLLRMDKAKRIRDHAARDKDAARDRLAADLRAFLERGGRVEEAKPMETIKGRAPARAFARAW